MSDVKFSALVKGAFGGRHYQYHDILVPLGEPGVLVFDPVAGHYTRRHRLTASQVKRLRSSPAVRQARIKSR